jgi:sigma-B regulation protein RsbU (phosphoserine phosphatase)
MPFEQIPPDVVLPGFEMAAATHPYQGETVNGDGLFVETGRHDGAFLLLLVDVMGHGPQTAGTMGVIQAWLGLAAAENRQPTDLLRSLHLVLEPLWQTNFTFATALTVLVDGATGDVVAANAGQPEPLAGRPRGGWQAWPVSGGIPLGIPQPIPLYPQAIANLPLGHCLLMFTDGVSEAGARAGRPQFQRAGLGTVLTGLPAGAIPAGIVSRLLAALQNYVGATWPEDDTTVVCLRRC